MAAEIFRQHAIHEVLIARREQLENQVWEAISLEPDSDSYSIQTARITETKGDIADIEIASKLHVVDRGTFKTTVKGALNEVLPVAMTANNNIEDPKIPAKFEATIGGGELKLTESDARALWLRFGRHAKAIHDRAETLEKTSRRVLESKYREIADRWQQFGKEELNYQISRARQFSDAIAEVVRNRANRQEPCSGAVHDGLVEGMQLAADRAHVLAYEINVLDIAATLHRIERRDSDEVVGKIGDCHVQIEHFRDKRLSNGASLVGSIGGKSASGDELTTLWEIGSQTVALDEAAQISQTFGLH